MPSPAAAAVARSSPPMPLRRRLPYFHFLILMPLYSPRWPRPPIRFSPFRHYAAIDAIAAAAIAVTFIAADFFTLMLMYAIFAAATLLPPR
jgi:hypothetical protein